MARYAALLRGINVGGNNIIKMADLISCFKDNNFQGVKTYIQSGNVIFDSSEINSDKLELTIERMLNKRFGYTGKVLVRSSSQIRSLVRNAPNDWNKRSDIRCYIAFIKKPLTPQKAVQNIDLKEGVDWIKRGPGAVYLTSLKSKLTKSRLNKLTTKKIYQDMTIRNYNTTRKIASLVGL